MINTQAYCIRVDRQREKKLSTIKKNKGTLWIHFIFFAKNSQWLMCQSYVILKKKKLACSPEKLMCKKQELSREEKSVDIRWKW